MPLLAMRHDFRAPDFGPASTSEIYTAALEQFRWADQQGWDFAVLSEHHGLDDGWLPAPLTIAGGDRRHDRAHPGAAERVDRPAARPGPPRRADRGARQRDRAGSGPWPARATAPRSSRWPARTSSSAGKILEEYVGVMLAGVDR